VGVSDALSQFGVDFLALQSIALVAAFTSIAEASNASCNSTASSGQGHQHQHQEHYLDGAPTMPDRGNSSGTA
jgi:hypothetical protein